MNLEEEIRKYPLAKENVELILAIKIKEIKFEPLICSGNLNPVPVIEPNDRGKYIIKINSLLSEEEQMLTLIHDIIHIRYNKVKLSVEEYEEELIEAEANRFYNENTDFVRKIYSSLK